MSLSAKRFVFLESIIFYSYIRVCFQVDAFIRENVWHKLIEAKRNTL